ncbi:MAG TPA: serine dehydratase beta chain, partial [Puia sp.]|nr:serine dehydratase beta chain [Puia sp.]
MPYEPISVFDIFKIGVGPSSSHTLGPWRAAQAFICRLNEQGRLSRLKKMEVFLFGSLAKTGKGHGTDIAIELGLSGYDPVLMDTVTIPGVIEQIAQERKLRPAPGVEIDFDPQADIHFLFRESLPRHPNAVRFAAAFNDGSPVFESTYYSIGGGFIETDEPAEKSTLPVQPPFPINSASDLLHWCMKTGFSIQEVVMENEKAWHSEEEIKTGLLQIWQVMKDCMYAGCHTEGVLPGGLQVRRRAAEQNRKLLNG